MSKLRGAAAGILALALALFPAAAQGPGACDAETGGAVAAWVIAEEEARASALSIGENLPVKSAVLMEQQSGKILYARNENEKLPPASVTKIMALLLFLEALEAGALKPEELVTCSAYACGFGGSQIWLKEGEQMSVDDLLKAVAIGSANDATVCLAERVAGSEPAFVERMNRRAAALGMENTVFCCAAGLDMPGHRTTAKDIALMSRELMTHPKIREYSTVWMDSLRGGATQLVNTNRLVRFYPGATGLKTGTTAGAGSCLSATAERDGLGLIAVVMGAPTSDERFAAARALLDWGYANYTFLPLSAPEEILPLSVTGGTALSVALDCTPPQGVVVETLKKEAVRQEILLPESAAAPVARGQQLGAVAVLCGDERLLEYPLTAAEEVPRMTFGRAFGMLGRLLLRLE